LDGRWAPHFGQADPPAESKVSFLDPVELTVVEETLSVELGGQVVRVVGEARNDSGLVVGLLQIEAAGIDADGALVDVAAGSPHGASAVVARDLPPGLVAPGETAWFTVTLSTVDDRVPETVLIRAHGRELYAAATGDQPPLEMLGEWQVDSDGRSHSLTGTVRNNLDEDVVGLSVVVALREPTGRMIDLAVRTQDGERISGFLGGVRPGETAVIEADFFIDPAVFDSATLETRLHAFLVGEPVHRYGVLGVAHRPGFNGTNWQSSLSLVNRSGATAQALLTFRHGGDRSQVWVDLDDGEATHWDDAAVELFGIEGESAGTVLITSPAPLMVSGRTSNEGSGGGFGQALPVVTPAMSYGFGTGIGRTGVLSMLRGGTQFRTNIGLVNMGGDWCTARVRIFDVSGDPVADWGWIELAPTEWRQVNRAVGESLETAYAVVDRELGCPVWAYASIIDEATGDPTTVVLEPWTEIDLWPTRGRGMIFPIPWADHDVDPLPH
jgi:hypothetical protein